MTLPIGFLTKDVLFSLCPSICSNAICRGPHGRSSAMIPPTSPTGQLSNTEDDGVTLKLQLSDPRVSGCERPTNVGRLDASVRLSARFTQWTRNRWSKRECCGSWRLGIERRPTGLIIRRYGKPGCSPRKIWRAKRIASRPKKGRSSCPGASRRPDPRQRPRRQAARLAHGAIGVTHRLHRAPLGWRLLPEHSLHAEQKRNLECADRPPRAPRSGVRHDDRPGHH